MSCAELRAERIATPFSWGFLNPRFLPVYPGARIPTFPQLRRRSLILREGEAKALPNLQRPKVGQIKPPEMGQKKLPNARTIGFSSYRCSRPGDELAFKPPFVTRHRSFPVWKPYVATTILPARAFPIRIEYSDRF